jgi:hypothetical protein
LQALNRCRLALKLLFLSDITTACGRLLNISLVLRPACPNKNVSAFVFPNEHPSPRDWELWLELWTAFAGPGWGLRNPLGTWEHPTHRRWEWFYDARDDLLIHLVSNTETIAYSIPGDGHRLQSRQIYQRSHALGQIPSHGLLATVLVLPGDQILCREIGAPLAAPRPDTSSFWTHLRWMGGKCMWEHIVEGGINVDWIRDTLAKGTFLAVTDGSYDRTAVPRVSGSGWMIVCTACQRTLRGSFIEVSPSAGSYRGKLLGLVAIHTFATAIAQYFAVTEILGTISCNNMAALNQASKNRKRVGVGVKHSDLHRMICTLKHSARTSFLVRTRKSPSRQAEGLEGVDPVGAAQRIMRRLGEQGN